jgi:hypothetical protein
MSPMGRPDSEEQSMQAITTICPDIAKSVFQVQGPLGTALDMLSDHPGGPPRDQEA